MADKKTATQLVRDTYETNVRYWRPYWDAMSQEEEFLDGNRYQDDAGPYNKDRRLIQIRGQETQDTIRHVAAKVTERPRSIEPRPVDRGIDGEISEVAASLVEWELSNQWKGFEDCYEAIVIDCRERRLGVLWMDWVPECGPWGEIIYSRIDGRNIMWDPEYDPHHPLCGWLWRRHRIATAKARKLYKAPWLQADRDAFTEQGEYKPGVPLVRGASGERLPASPDDVDDDKVTVWELWYKNDNTEKPDPIEDRSGLSPFDDPGQRYMLCDTCGYHSPTQTELIKQGKIQTGLPVELEGCPKCQELMAEGADIVQPGVLKRVDGTQQQDYARAYARGHRLVIIAPFCQSPDDKPLYDGKWPIPQARSFPIMVLTSYVKPGRPMGPSDTTLMWDQQIASDNLRTLAVQRIFEHRNYWVLPAAGINDYQGHRFNFREDQYNVMYRDGSQATMGPLDVQQISGTGLDPQFMAAFNIVQQALTQYRGVADLGLTPDNTKNIAASTVAQLNQMGEVPTAHFNRRKNRALSQFYGVVWDYISATLTPAKAARLNIDGLDMLMGIHGDSLPNYDFQISDTPEFTGLEKTRSEAFNSLMEVAMKAPQFLDIYAEMNNLPRSVLRRVQKRLDEIQEQQMEQEAKQGLETEIAGGSTTPGGKQQDGGFPPAQQQPTQGLAGAGLEPAPVA